MALIQKHSIWLVSSRYVVVWVNVKRLLFVTMLLVGLVLSGCGGDVAVAPVGKHAKSSKWSPNHHTVRRGETLYSIAFQYGQDYRSMARRNGIRHPYTIYVGQKLKIRGSKLKHKNVVTKSSASKQKATKKPAKPYQKQTKQPKSVTHTQTKPKTIRKVGPVRWHWPTHGRVIETFSNKSSTRKGIDIAGRLGQSVKAAGAGQVVYSGSGLRGYGKLIIVKHNEQYLSAYAHNRKLLVKEGDRVKLGQRIAEMGRSGADRIKLHFEIRREGNPVDPMHYLPKRSS